jgi:hypothetical protein
VASLSSSYGFNVVNELFDPPGNHKIKNQQSPSNHRSKIKDHKSTDLRPALFLKPSNRQHYLSDVRARLHERVSRCGLGQPKRAMHVRLHLPLLQQRPDLRA